MPPAQAPVPLQQNTLALARPNTGLFKWLLYGLLVYFFIDAGLRLYAILSSLPVSNPPLLRIVIESLISFFIQGLIIFGVYKQYRIAAIFVVVSNFYFLLSGFGTFLQPNLFEIILMVRPLLSVLILVLALVVIYKAYAARSNDGEQISRASKWGMRLSLLLLIGSGLFILFLAISTIYAGFINLLLCCELPGGTFSVAVPQILLSFLALLLPEVVLGVFWFIAVFLYARKKYIWSASSLIFASLAFLSLGIYGSHKYKQDNTPLVSPPSGFLMPAPDSQPQGFMQTSHQFFSSEWMITYFSSDFLDVYIETSENRGNGNYQTAVQNMVSSGFTKLLDFTYRNEPGVIYANEATVASSSEIALLWNDSGNALTIILNTFSLSTSTYNASPNDLTNMLESYQMTPYTGEEALEKDNPNPIDLRPASQTQ